MTDPALELCADYDGSLGLYCTICWQPVTGYPDQTAMLTINGWPGSVSLAEVLEVAAQHQHQPQA